MQATLVITFFTAVSSFAIPAMARTDIYLGTCMPFSGAPPQPCRLHFNDQTRQMAISGFQAAPILRMVTEWKAIDHQGTIYKVLKHDNGATTFLEAGENAGGKSFTFNFN